MKFKSYNVEFDLCFGMDNGFGEWLTPHLDKEGNLIIHIEGDLHESTSYRVLKDNVVPFLRDMNKWIEDYNTNYGWNCSVTYENNYIDYKEITLRVSKDEIPDNAMKDIETFDELYKDCLEHIATTTPAYADEEDVEYFDDDGYLICNDFDEDDEDFDEDDED